MKRGYRIEKINQAVIYRARFPSVRRGDGGYLPACTADNAAVPSYVVLLYARLRKAARLVCKHEFIQKASGWFRPRPGDDIKNKAVYMRTHDIYAYSGFHIRAYLAREGFYRCGAAV